MLQITNIRQGAVLNHNHGKEDDKGLTVFFEGISDFPGPVTLNGQATRRDGRRFMGEVTLTEKFNTVTAESVSAYGNFSQSIVVVWDKKSFKRVNFYIDDHSFFWTDLARERPKHAFDHFYLKGLKEIHDRTGLKVTLNCFYHNDHFDCDMTQVPDIWKSEFIDNSDWLKLSFHSLGEFPDRLYIEAGEEEFARDYDIVHDEIVRIAGEAPPLWRGFLYGTASGVRDPKGGGQRPPFISAEPKWTSPPSHKSPPPCGGGFFMPRLRGCENPLGGRRKRPFISAEPKWTSLRNAKRFVDKHAPSLSRFEVTYSHGEDSRLVRWAFVMLGLAARGVRSAVPFWRISGKYTLLLL